MHQAIPPRRVQGSRPSWTCQQQRNIILRKPFTVYFQTNWALRARRIGDTRLKFRNDDFVVIFCRTSIARTTNPQQTLYTPHC